MATTVACRSTLLLAVSAGFVGAHAAPASSDEQTLRYKLVVQPAGKPATMPEIGGHTATVGEYMGVAVFEDGRIAHKRFVDISDDTATGGNFKGYSTYTFENGDSLTFSYTGEWNDQGLTGAYTLLSGTGQYANATGTGSFKGVDEPWEQANLLEGSFQLTVPSQ
ncbi:hypothetical protein [Geminicoccus flavidas]|uniref:hypothetical protein n=1 Tax=Geminicoccus flavidas TaxID=2506407 RepID=UPI00135BD3C5|nr:hypothetical protein [Geminicoccus flavidas]